MKIFELPEHTAMCHIFLIYDKSYFGLSTHEIHVIIALHLECQLFANINQQVKRPLTHSDARSIQIHKYETIL